MISGLRVSLVIPAYNQVGHTIECLKSIRRQPDQPDEIIVIDNASTDGTADYLRQADVRVITNTTNLGCAKAWNQGIRASQGEAIGILNNDILVTRGWLEHLLAFMSKTGHGIVSPSAREGPLSYDLDQYAAEFTCRCAQVTRSEVYGACMFIRRAVFDRVGLFDEGFTYGGYEDIDFIWRVKQAGFSIGMTGAVLIHHFGMMTQDAIKRTETRAYPERNMAHFQNKWKRTVRGSWAERRWVNFRSAVRERYELIRYGHTLVEKNRKAITLAERQSATR